MTNGTMLQFFEWYLPADATLWKTAAARAGELAAAGFTAAWLPPAYKGAGGINDVGYAVYDTYDLGEFDQKGSVPTKYGTRAEYLAAVKALQAAGVNVLADVVLNHRIGADGTEDVQAVGVAGDNHNWQQTGTETVRAYTRFTFPGRAGKYSDFTWDWHCFDGVDWDDLRGQGKIFRFDGKQWDSEVDGENGNYDFLMGADLDMSEPKVLQELDTWGKWYLDTTGADGVRLDAVKHINRDFYCNWLRAMREHTGKELFAVGEYWNNDLGKLVDYLNRDGSCMSLFDVPLHFNFFNACHSGGGFDMRKLLENTLVSARPMQAVTFVDNHDTQPGQALSSFVDAWFKPLAYAVILLREAGYPCVFYGDYYGIPHDNVQPVAALPTLLKARHDLAYGAQHDYFDHPDVIGWTREGDAAHPGSGLAVLVTDGPGGGKHMFVGNQHAGKTFAPLWGGGQPVQIGADGCGDFGVDGGSVRVYALADSDFRL